MSTFIVSIYPPFSKPVWIGVSANLPLSQGPARSVRQAEEAPQEAAAEQVRQEAAHVAEQVRRQPPGAAHGRRGQQPQARTAQNPSAAGPSCHGHEAQPEGRAWQTISLRHRHAAFDRLSTPGRFPPKPERACTESGARRSLAHKYYCLVSLSNKGVYAQKAARDAVSPINTIVWFR